MTSPHGPVTYQWPDTPTRVLSLASLTSTTGRRGKGRTLLRVLRLVLAS